jgi:hypothetical protein
VSTPTDYDHAALHHDVTVEQQISTILVAPFLSQLFGITHLETDKCLLRLKTRTHLSTSQMGNYRALFADGVATLRRSIPLRCWRSRSTRLGTPNTAIYIRASYPQLPILGQSEREGVLAGEIASCMYYVVQVEMRNG